MKLGYEQDSTQASTIVPNLKPENEELNLGEGDDDYDEESEAEQEIKEATWAKQQMSQDEVKKVVLNPEVAAQEEAKVEEEEEETDLLGKKIYKKKKPIINPWNTKRVQTSRYINQAQLTAADLENSEMRWKHLQHIDMKDDIKSL